MSHNSLLSHTALTPGQANSGCLGTLDNANSQTQINGDGNFRTGGDHWAEHPDPVWTFDCPAEATVAVETLIIAGHSPSTWRMLPSASIANRIGTWVLDVDGSTVGEGVCNGRPMSSTEVGAQGSTGPDSGQYGFVIPLHDGIILTSGQVLTVYWTPHTLDSEGIPPQVVHATGWGVDASTGAPIYFAGNYPPTDATSSQIALQYTAPANGIKLKSLTVYSVQHYPVILFNARILLNNQVIFRVGNLIFDSTSSRSALVIIPMTGFTLYPGDRLELVGSLAFFGGKTLGVSIIGTTTPIGFTRARSVNR